MYKFVLVILFFVFSPGVFLTLPAGSKGVWMSRQTSVAAAIVHALVFVIVLHFFGRPLRVLENFITCGTGQKICNKIDSSGRSSTYCSPAGQSCPSRPEPSRTPPPPPTPPPRRERK